MLVTKLTVASPVVALVLAGAVVASSAGDEVPLEAPVPEVVAASPFQDRALLETVIAAIETNEEKISTATMTVTEVNRTPAESENRVETFEVAGGGSATFYHCAECTTTSQVVISGPNLRCEQSRDFPSQKTVWTFDGSTWTQRVDGTPG